MNEQKPNQNIEEKQDQDNQKTKEKIVTRIIEDEMRESYLSYAMSVIVSRALPDVRDGLKPVHRRILYTMWEIGLLPNKPYRKSANVVGNCMARYHPHGDAAIYDSMVRMAQSWVLRYPLVQGQGNFGCFTGDTKVKLTDGRSLSFKELIKEHKQGKKNYTYTVDSNGLIKIAEIKEPRLTKKNQKIIKITLDNGKEIKCTLDHRFMLRDGSYVQTQNLKKGDSLKSFNSKDNKVSTNRLMKKTEDVYDLTIDKTHNFALAAGIFVHNSIDGDAAAAMRYSEARLSKISTEMLTDIEKETVNFQPNFDGSLKEPVVLPSKIPNLLLNGSSGIAVGMATNIPPHNLIETCDGTIHVIDNPDCKINEIMNFIKGPDFPTGGIIIGRSGIENAYLNGRGKIKIRAKTKIEEKKDRKRIIINEIPYQLNKSSLIEEIADNVRNRKITGIRDIRDESDKQGMRIVIILKKGANTNVVLNQLYKKTRLQTTFGINMLALVNNEPKTLNLKQIIKYFIEHRKEVVRRKTTFELKKAELRAHILEGLIIALSNIDNVVQKIKASKDVNEATNVLIKDYSLTDIQAKAILDMKLQKLSSLEQKKIKNEHEELLSLIEELKSILASKEKILDIIKKQLSELKEIYGDERKTEIIKVEEKIIEIEDMIKEEDMIITVTHQGYIKRLPIHTYKKQKRGGKGVIATSTKEEDFVSNLFIASTHSYILFFTNKGQVHWLKVYEIPEASRQAKGKAIVNLLNIKNGKITAMVPVRKFQPGDYLIMATRNGIVKKVDLVMFKKPRKGGIRAITLEPDDYLINVVKTNGNNQILLATKNGKAIRFKEQDLRSIGRSGKGVKGIYLKGNDAIIDIIVVDNDKDILTVTENGYGKRTKIEEYRIINRGGVGVINIKTNERNGKVIGVCAVKENDEVMLISKNGVMIRMAVKGISCIGRNTLGVRIMKLEKNDKLVAITKVVKEEKNSNKE